MSDGSLLATENLFHYFYERVMDARGLCGAELEQDTEFYLVNLLADFLRTGHLVESGGRRVDEVPLAIRLLDAQLSAPADQYRELKHLADTTLYVLGWFAESLRRSTVDRSYYAGLGGTAYHRLAELPHAPRRPFEDPVFRELADKFGEAVEIITEVREQALLGSNDVLALYEQWLATGSERIADRLREMGVVLDAGPSAPVKILH